MISKSYYVFHGTRANIVKQIISVNSKKPKFVNMQILKIFFYKILLFFNKKIFISFCFQRTGSQEPTEKNGFKT